MLVIIFILFSDSVKSADWYFGLGEIYQADELGHRMYSVSREEARWKFGISYWDSYPKTAWLPEHPEWGVEYVDSHYMLAIVRTLFQYKVTNELEFYFDFGLTYTSELSSVNSSDFNFQENLGFAYKNLRLYLRHTSNAKIKSPNRGEDALVIEVGFNL